MKNRRVSSFALLIIILSSCTNNTPKSESIDTSSDKKAETVSIDSSSITEPSLDVKGGQMRYISGDTVEIQGILKEVSAAELGPSHISVEVEGNVVEFEDWTGAGGSGGVSELLIGKEVAFKYVFIENFREVDLHITNKSVHGEYASIVTDEDKNKPNLERVEGVLSWSMNKHGVSGDTPSNYSIIKADGSEVEVTGWVYEDLFLKLNGKQVTVYGYPSGNIFAFEVTPINEIAFIREKFDIINNKMAAAAYTIIEFKVDGEKGVIQYKRVMDGEEIRFLSITYNSTFGSDKTSYYFWEDLVFFQFQENSQWADHRDFISEKRTYYYGEEVIRCLQREIKETGGYDQVRQQLANTAQTILPNEGKFDRRTIKALIDLTEESALQTPDLLYPKIN